MLGNVELVSALIVAIFGPSSAAFVGVKVALNGTRDRVKNIEERVEKTDAKLDTLLENYHGVDTRVVLLETERRTGPVDRRATPRA